MNYSSLLRIKSDWNILFTVKHPDLPNRKGQKKMPTKLHQINLSLMMRKPLTSPKFIIKNYWAKIPSLPMRMWMSVGVWVKSLTASLASRATKKDRGWAKRDDFARLFLPFYYKFIERRKKLVKGGIKRKWNCWDCIAMTKKNTRVLFFYLFGNSMGLMSYSFMYRLIFHHLPKKPTSRILWWKPRKPGLR